MTIQLLHVADLHFGGVADLRQIEALEAMLPDLRPDAVVIAGDTTQRCRHGELQRARAFVQTARQTAPVLDYYRRTGRLREVDGTGAPDEVFGRVTASLA